MRFGKSRQNAKTGTSDRSRNRLKRLWELGKEIADLFAKLAAPAAVIAAAILAQSFQTASNVSQLLQQREESDTKIRAEMFKAITERLFSAGGSLSPGQKAVFSELLALNFHEHIEVKPLMLEIDSVLAGRMPSGKVSVRKRNAFAQQREELWSVARRVRARQIAMLVADAGDADSSLSEDLLQSARAAVSGFAGWIGVAHAESPPRPHLEIAHVEFLGVRFPADPRLAAESSASQCDVLAEEGQNGMAGELMGVTSPGGGSNIAIVVEKADWDAERFSLRVKLDAGRLDAPSMEGQSVGDREKPAGPGEKSRSSTIKGRSAVLFETTWFDFPLTDNTLLASGDRFAVFIDEVCKPTAGQVLNAVRLGVLWFPMDYFPPRERPTNYHQSREELGLGNRT